MHFFLKKYKFSISLISILTFVSLIFESLIVFLIPGILILKKNGKNIITIISEIIAISCAFWIISFWFLEKIQLNFNEIKYFLIILTISASIILDSKINFKKTNINTKNLLTALIFLLSILLFFFFPTFLILTPAGGDMSMHTYISRMIIEAQGMPNTYFPIIDTVKFDNYPIGFHVLISFFSFFENIPVYTSAKFITSFSYFFLTISLFNFLSKFFDFYKSLYIAIFAIFFSQILEFIGWGGNPTILSIAFFGMFLSKFFSDEKKILDIFMMSVYFCASFFTTFIITYAGCFIFVLPFIFNLIIKKDIKSIKLIVYFALFSFFLLSSFFLNISELDEIQIKQMTRWIRDFDHSWSGNLNNFFYSIPFYFNERVGKFFMIISLIFLFYFFSKNRKITNIIYLNILYVFTTFILVLNTKFFLLPYSYILWPERFTMLLIFPLSIFIGYGLNVLNFNSKKKFTKKIFIFCIITYISLLTFERKLPYKNYIRKYIEMSNVTNDDLKAILWLKNNTSKNDIINNNYGDAGIWIPAIIFRKITRPHLTSKLEKNYYESIKFTDRRIMDENKADYIFIGSKCVYNCPIKKEDIKLDKRYKLIKKFNETLIFKNIK